MKHMRVALASLFALVAADLSASPTIGMIGDIGIVTNPGPYARDASSGYAMHRIQILNRSSSETHRVHLRIPAEPRGLPGVNAYLHSVSKTFVIPPSSMVNALIHQPPLPMYRGPTIAVSVIGKREKGSVHLRSMKYLHAAEAPTAVHPSFVSYAFEPRILMNGWKKRNLYSVVMDQTAKFVSSASAGGSSMALPRIVNRSYYYDELRAIDFKAYPSKPIWLNYTTFEGIVYSDDYAEYLKPTGRNALWRYVDCGGSLAYFGSGKMQAWWSELDPRLADKVLKHGAFEKYEIGFGALYLIGIDDEALAASSASTSTYKLPDGAIDIAKSWYEAEPARNQLHTAYGANQVLPMAEPIDSRASYQRVVSLTHLDQQTGRAATIGWTAYYSPLKNADELRFDENTELTPLAFGSELVGSVDWTDGQRLTGGWVPAGVPRHFKLRKNEDRPEHIELKKEGGALKVVNRLGARVKSFWYADDEGKVYQAADIPNGAESVLTETNGVKIGLKKLRDVYVSQDWVAKIEAVRASPAAYLQLGQYFAELEENAFVGGR